LLIVGSPTTVVWFVIAIIVDTINRMRGTWLSAHIGKKIAKDMPTLADLNAAAAVVFEPWIIRISASGTHGNPRTIFRRHFVTTSLAVNASELLYSMPACACVTVAQTISSHDCLLAAVAKTEPKISAVSVFDWLDGD
jgi:hypothetical protein